MNLDTDLKAITKGLKTYFRPLFIYLPKIPNLSKIPKNSLTTCFFIVIDAI